MSTIAPTVTVAPHVLTRIVGDVGLDPQAVGAVASRLSPRQLAGLRPLPPCLPGLAADPEVARELDELGEQARAIARLAAVAVVDRVDVLLAAAGLTPEEWVESPAARLLIFHAGRFSFRNPRVRADLRENMSSAEALVAHRTLARSCESLGVADVALWHATVASASRELQRVDPLDALARRLLSAGDAAHAYDVAAVAADQAVVADQENAAERFSVAVATAAKTALCAGYLDTARSWQQRGERSPGAAAGGAANGGGPAAPYDCRQLGLDPPTPFDHWVWPHGGQPAPTPMARAEMVIARCLALFAAGNIGEARSILLGAAYRLPIATASHGAGAALARRLDLAVTGRIGPTANALYATSPHRASPGFRLSAHVDEAIGAALSGDLERARVLFAIERQRDLDLSRLPAREFDELEAWILTEGRAASEAPPGLAERLESPNDPRVAWARIILAKRPSSAEVESAEARLTRIESPYERAHAELCAAAAFDHLGDRPAARAHLIAASAQFAEAGTPAFRELAERQLRQRPARNAPQRDTARQVGTRQPNKTAVREPLTGREIEVAEVLATGASNRDIARALGLSIRTVEVHLSRIYRKLGVRSRVEFLLLSGRASS